MLFTVPHQLWGPQQHCLSTQQDADVLACSQSLVQPS